MFHSIKFIKGDTYREVWISDYRGLHYSIVTQNSPFGGKFHEGSATKYISNILSNGWRKVNDDEYWDVRLGLNYCQNHKRLDELKKKREKLLADIKRNDGHVKM